MTEKHKKLDLTGLLYSPEPHQGSARFFQTRNVPDDPGTFNGKLADRFSDAVDTMSGGSGHFTVKNSDRSVGARLSGMIAAKHGNKGMSAAPVTLNLDGTAGQSFGAWNAGGLHMILSGDANDYVGKGMAGGKLVIRHPRGCPTGLTKQSSWETPVFTVPPAESYTPPGWPGNALPSGTPGQTQWWRASEKTAVST